MLDSKEFETCKELSQFIKMEFTSCNIPMPNNSNVVITGKTEIKPTDYACKIMSTMSADQLKLVDSYYDMLMILLQREFNHDMRKELQEFSNKFRRPLFPF